MVDGLIAWFRSLFSHAPPALQGVDLAREQWDDVPLPRGAPPWRHLAGRPDDDADWDAVIARAKMRAPSPPPPSPSPRRPPPVPAKARAVREWAPPEVQAKLDAVIRSGPKRFVRPLPSFVVRRADDEDWDAAIRQAKAQRPVGPAPGRLNRGR